MEGDSISYGISHSMLSSFVFSSPILCRPRKLR